MMTVRTLELKCKKYKCVCACVFSWVAHGTSFKKVDLPTYLLGRRYDTSDIFFFFWLLFLWQPLDCTCSEQFIVVTIGFASPRIFFVAVMYIYICIIDFRFCMIINGKCITHKC